MQFTSTPIAGAFVVSPEERRDERGFFARLWCQHELAGQGLNARFVQCNSSFSHARGTLRGLHYQTAPYGEAKLIGCTRGSILDVIVDLRRDSSSYLQAFATELTEQNRLMVYVPEGCAHGYLTLADNSEVVYPVTEFYHPEAEAGLRWDDPVVSIAWPERPRVISPKDLAWPDYQR
jgi:dTDP-4-dehydrorhamnose 3,5-epimerase